MLSALCERKINLSPFGYRKRLFCNHLNIFTNMLTFFYNIFIILKALVKIYSILSLKLKISAVLCRRIDSICSDLGLTSLHKASIAISLVTPKHGTSLSAGFFSFSSPPDAVELVRSTIIRYFQPLASCVTLK